MPDMDIETIKTQIDSEFQNINSPEKLEDFRVRFLGRKGIIASLTSVIPTLAAQERGRFGQQVNLLKNKILSLIEEKQKTLAADSAKYPAQLKATNMDLPGIAQDLGRLHPLTQIINETCNIFKQMGFSLVEGPEIETEYNNFTGLNIPLEHPSRDVFDTFYLKGQDKLLLRSHTSPAQIRVMKSRKPPLAVVVPGRVYRPDAVDASHSFMFHQIEGLMVDKGIKFSDLKGVLEVFAKAVFGQEIKMRFRPHFFPFTEPSAEVDISCIICGSDQLPVTSNQKKNCSVCH
ncbi:MAG: phenylalanine--tRNA ligase subunit alpha, partial [Candidatus Omnitrophica bacterium]|nr:phenylalanine--tRNA ligase subunit alpha [Candidatus Omnitrophota bacterium]